MTLLKDIDKSSIKKELIDILDTYSSKELTQNELQSLKEKQDNINNYLYLLDAFKKETSSNEELFIKSLNSFVSNSLSIKEDELSELLVIYFLKTVPTITDFFNTQELENRKNHTKKIKKIFVNNIEKIIFAYEESLKCTIKKLDK